MKKMLAPLVAAFTFAVVELAAATSHPTGYDLSGATDGVSSQLTSVLTAVLPVAGGIIALFIGWKVLKRMVKA